VSAKIVKVEYYLPETVITNNDLAKEFPEWSSDKKMKQLLI
jgi:3-oxoacyl-[acyl-carrier-protein] synthase-3